MSVNTMKEIKTEFSSDLNISSNCITNETVIKKEEVEEAATSFTTPIENWHPLVLTTRLDDMCVFQKPFLYGKPQTIIRKIYLESKAASQTENMPDFKYVCRCSKKIKKKHKLKFKNVQDKLERIKRKTKLESTVENITKAKKRSVTVVEVSSDDDDNLLTYAKAKRSKVKNSNNTIKSYLSDNEEQKKIDNSLKANSISETEHYNNLCKIVELKIIKTMSEVDSNIVIVVNNSYSQTTDIYVTDEINRIFKYVTVPLGLGRYSLFYKLLATYNTKQKVKPVYHLLWINCCCWVQRQNEIKRKCLRNIAHFLFSSHMCHLKCSCCCKEEKSEPSTFCDTEVYSSEENSDTSIAEEEICNPLIKRALNFRKPTSKSILNSKLNKQYKDEIPIYIQFIFKTVCRKDKHVESKVSDSKSNNETEEALLNNHLEFVKLGLRRELVWHSFNVPPKLVSMLDSVRKVTDMTLDVCCEVRFRWFTKMLCVKYDIRPDVFKYIEGIHKCNIYHTYINKRPDECTQCKIYDYIPDTAIFGFKVVLTPIEHTRKVIKGRLVHPKLEMPAHSKHIDEKTETIQEIIEKVKTKFPNMSYFINDQGHHTASLPMPFHYYPVEDIKLLTRVLEFAQNKIMNQKQLPGGTEVELKQVKSGNEITCEACEVTKKLELQTVNSNTQTKSKQLIENNRKSKPATIQITNNYDSRTLIIKCNKESYYKAFQSFVNNSIDPDRMTRQDELRLPKIVDVCSLIDNKELAKKLHDDSPDEISKI